VNDIMVLELLGDYYRVQGIAEQPVEEPGPGGAIYYWFEVFRRASLVRAPYPCWRLSLDVHVNIDVDDGLQSRVFDRVLDLDNTEILLVRDPVLEEVLRHYADANGVELEILVSRSHDMTLAEVISVHTQICGYVEPPPYHLVETLYREVVRYLEKRDLISSPLWVDTKYIMQSKPS